MCHFSLEVTRNGSSSKTSIRQPAPTLETVLPGAVALRDLLGTASSPRPESRCGVREAPIRWPGRPPRTPDCMAALPAAPVVHGGRGDRACSGSLPLWGGRGRRSKRGAEGGASVPGKLHVWVRVRAGLRGQQSS